MYILSNIISAALEGDIKKGILKVFTFVAGVSTNPGQINLIFKSLLFSDLIDSARLIKAALEGPYNKDFGRPL